MFYAKIILISTVNWIITNALVLIVMMSTTGREGCVRRPNASINTTNPNVYLIGEMGNVDVRNVKTKRILKIANRQHALNPPKRKLNIASELR
jgi:hypothetical protein